MNIPTGSDLAPVKSLETLMPYFGHTFSPLGHKYFQSIKLRGSYGQIESAGVSFFAVVLLERALCERVLFFCAPQALMGNHISLRTTWAPIQGTYISDGRLEMVTNNESITATAYIINDPAQNTTSELVMLNPNAYVAYSHVALLAY